jgi:hypothetical protein
MLELAQQQLGELRQRQQQQPQPWQQQGAVQLHGCWPHDPAAEYDCMLVAAAAAAAAVANCSRVQPNIRASRMMVQAVTPGRQLQRAQQQSAGTALAPKQAVAHHSSCNVCCCCGSLVMTGAMLAVVTLRTQQQERSAGSRSRSRSRCAKRMSAAAAASNSDCNTAAVMHTLVTGLPAATDISYRHHHNSPAIAAAACCRLSLLQARLLTLG